LAVYDQTRRLLADRLGVDPSPELSAVHLGILRADPALSSTPKTAPAVPDPATAIKFPEASIAHRRFSTPPSQLTSFVGREDELERVAKQLGDTRLVTLTGPGGAGKTRLALEAATLKAAELPNGA